MSEPAAEPYGAYRFTSIARPVEPRFPTNRLVLQLLPVAAVLGAGVALYQGAGVSTALLAALTYLLIAFASWALTRELAPDDNPAAFIAMALAIAMTFVGTDSVLLLFVALFLARIVNRTTGLAPKPIDSALVAGFVSWATFGLDQPLIGLVGAFAFATDGTLADGRRWQYLPAAVCLGATTWATLADGIPLAIGTLNAAQGAFVIIATVAYGVVVYRSRVVASVGDIHGKPLAPGRVQLGMVVGLLVALQAVLTAGVPALTTTPIWATLVAVPVGAIVGGVLSGGSAENSAD